MLDLKLRNVKIEDQLNKLGKPAAPDDFGEPRLFEYDVIQSASNERRMGFNVDLRSTSTMLAGTLSAILGLLVCEMWCLHRNAWNNASTNDD